MFVNSNGAQYTNDVLKYLGKYCMYWWKRRTQETITTGTETDVSSGKYFGSSSTIAYSNQLMTESDLVSKGTKLTLGTTETANAKIAQTLVDNAPCYVADGYGNVYKIPSGATFSTTYSSTLTLYMESANVILNSSATIKVKAVTNITTTTQYTDWEYLQSTDRNTYPDSGTSGDYEYVFLDIPFEQTKESVKIQTGSYVGTGTYGSSNPCSLTFDFTPKLIIISSTNENNAGKFYEDGSGTLLWNDYPSKYVGSKYRCYFTVTNQTFSWYSSDDNGQYNVNNTTYVYVAVGE